MRLVLLLAATFGCGDNETVYTWGDLSQAVSEAYCTRGETCEVGIEYESCLTHSVFHLCGLPDNCDSVLSPEAEAYAQLCADTLLSTPDNYCTITYYFGALPPSCYEAFSYEPN